MAAGKIIIAIIYLAIILLVVGSMVQVVFTKLSGRKIHRNDATSKRSKDNHCGDKGN